MKMMPIRLIKQQLPHNFNIIKKAFSRTLCSNAPMIDVKVNDSTGIAIVTMQRPPVNGLNLELLKALANTFDDLSANKSKGMILTSNLPTIFSGGLDIMEFVSGDPNRQKEFWISLQDCWLKLYGSSFPTAAAINGHSPAGGCLLASSCEYRVMVQGKYTIGLNETALGIAAPVFFQNTIKNIISLREAELALTLGKLFPVEEALKIGLIDEIAVSKEDAIEKCGKFLEKFAKISPMARTISKLSFREKTLKELEDTREEDLQKFLLAMSLPKVQKGLQMYVESLKKKGN